MTSEYTSCVLLLPPEISSGSGVSAPPPTPEREKQMFLKPTTISQINVIHFILEEANLDLLEEGPVKGPTSPKPSETKSPDGTIVELSTGESTGMYTCRGVGLCKYNPTKTK